jgi:hypothetical protein
LRHLTFLEKLNVISTTHRSYNQYQNTTQHTGGYSSKFLNDTDLMVLFSNITFNTEKILMSPTPVISITPPLELLRNSEGIIVLQTKIFSVMTQRFTDMSQIIDCFNDFLSGGRNREILLFSIEVTEWNGTNYLVRYEKMDWDYLTDYSYYKNEFIDFKLRKHEFKTT